MARIREQNDQAPSKAYFQKMSNAAYTLNTYSAPGVSGEKKTMEDETHVGWKQRIRRGEIVNGRMLLNKYKRSASVGLYFYSSKYAGVTYTTKIWGDVLGAVDQKVTFDQNVWQQPLSTRLNIELVNAYAKLSDDSIMSGEVMSSIGQSLAMIRRPFGGAIKHLGKIYSSARKRYRKTAASVTRANADAWLEYRYGWTPLFLDIEKGFDLYLRSEEKMRNAFKIVRASSGFDHSLSKPYDVSCTAPVNYRAAGTATETVNGQAAAGVFYSLAGRTGAQFAAEGLQLGASSIATTAWELIPYSFVADWFVQVGPWLAAVNVPPSVTVRGNWGTTKFEQIVANSCSAILVWQSPVWTSGSGGSSTRYWTQVYRRVNLPLPLTPPVLQFLPSVIHATDALALLTGEISSLLSKLRH